MPNGYHSQPRHTFVGTPLYVSPEMLQETMCLHASDLWALGCIIFRMHTGRVPFDHRIETQLFEAILTKDYEFPSDIPDDAKDLIDKLLQINPQHRLGAGRPGSGNDMEALKRHPYFNGIDFANISSMVSPLA